MIRILRSTGTDALVEIKTDIYDAEAGEGRVTLLFRCKTGSKLEMVLLHERLRTQLEQAMQDLRKVEYLRGYKDGRAKRRKKDWFFYDLDTDEYAE